MTDLDNVEALHALSVWANLTTVLLPIVKKSSLKGMEEDGEPVKSLTKALSDVNAIHAQDFHYLSTQQPPLFQRNTFFAVDYKKSKSHPTIGIPQNFLEVICGTVAKQTKLLDPTAVGGTTRPAPTVLLAEHTNEEVAIFDAVNKCPESGDWKAMKVPELKDASYSGTTDDNLVDWARRAASHAELYEVPKDRHASLYSQHLSGNARAWWMATFRSQTPPVGLWNIYVALKTTFSKPSDDFVRRERLRALRMTTSWPDYLHSFELIASQIANLSAPEKIFCCVDGLIPEYKTKAKECLPDSWLELVSLLTAFNNSRTNGSASSASLLAITNEKKKEERRKSTKNNQKKPQASKEESRKEPCAFCLKTGHSVERCFKRREVLTAAGTTFEDKKGKDSGRK
jgi:hypothetical protein